MSDIKPNITAAGNLAPAVNWLIQEIAEPVVRPTPQKRYVSVDKNDFNRRPGHTNPMSKETKRVLMKDNLWQTASIDRQGSFTRGTMVYVNIQVQIGGYDEKRNFVCARRTYAHANVVAGEEKSKKKNSKEIEVKKGEEVGILRIQNALEQSSSDQKSRWIVKVGEETYDITVEDPPGKKGNVTIKSKY